MNNLVAYVGLTLAVVSAFALVTNLPADKTALWVLFLIGLAMALGGFLSKEIS